MLVRLEGVDPAAVVAANFSGQGQAPPPFLSLLGPKLVTFTEDGPSVQVLGGVLLNPEGAAIEGGSFRIETGLPDIQFTIGRHSDLRVVRSAGDVLLATKDGVALGHIDGVGTGEVSVTRFTAAMTHALLQKAMTSFVATSPGDSPWSGGEYVVKLTLDLPSKSATLDQRIDVATIEDATVLGADLYTVQPGGVLVGNLLDNDHDPDSFILVDRINGSPNDRDGDSIVLASGARLRLYEGGRFEYRTDAGPVTPRPDGYDSFTYTTRGDDGGTQTVRIRVGDVAGGDVTGTAAGDLLFGGSGTDRFDLSQGGSDTAVAGAGDDELRFVGALGAGDRVSAGAGHDRLVLQGDYALDLRTVELVEVEEILLLSGSDTRFAAAGTARHAYDLRLGDATVSSDAFLIDGSGLLAGERLLFSAAAEDAYSRLEVLGGAGDDRLGGGVGADTLVGAAGDDVLRGDWGDALHGGSGDDKLFVGSGARVFEAAGGGYDVVRVDGDSYWLDDGQEIEEIEVLGDGGTQVFGNAFANRIKGGIGDDLLNGLGGSDTLIGGYGDDDYTVDEAGVRVIEGADAGVDTVSTTLSTYTLAANVENLRFVSWEGGFGGMGNALGNRITGGYSDDRLAGDAGDDRLEGGEGSDVLRGDDGRDQLFGGEDEDRLYGGAGDDVLTGGGAADLLVGGAGADVLTGDGGADRFQFASRLDLGDGSGALDRIADFRRADRDRIDLALVDADETVAGDQALRFVGAAAFTGVAGELRAERVGGVTRVSGDVDGDAVADFVFEAAGAPPLAQVDFIL